MIRNPYIIGSGSRGEKFLGRLLLQFAVRAGYIGVLTGSAKLKKKLGHYSVLEKLIMQFMSHSP